MSVVPRRVTLGTGRRRLAAIGALGLAAVTLVVLAVSHSGNSGDKTPQAATTSTATTEILRQDLVEVDEEDGTLGYSGERAVVNRLSGTVTSLPRQGAVIRADQTLFQVDRTPVILMDGRVPAYRGLKAGVSDGVDVAQLEANLRALGYDPGGAILVDGHWTSATTAAVERWQAAHGFRQTGSIALGRVVFQSGTRRVSSVEATLGGDAGSSQGSGGTNSGASYNGSTATLRFASSTTGSGQGTDTAPQTTTPQTSPKTQTKKKTAKKKTAKKKTKKKSSTTSPQSTPSSGSGGSSSTGASASTSTQQQGGGSSTSGGTAAGQQSAPAATLLKTTSTRSQVEVKLDTAKESLARKGERVTVSLPGGQSVRGRIASVGKVATKASASGTTGGSSSGSSSSSTATIPVTIRIYRATALDQAPATVRFEKSRRKQVLTIPVSALLARAGGRFGVEVRSGGGRRLVEVTPGLYTSGYVEISGPGLKPGMKVTDARV